MDIKKRTHRMVLVTIIMILILAGLFFLITNTITKYTGYSVSDTKENDFEKCIKKQDITLFINSENPSKTLNQVELKDYLKYFKIVNCLRNNKICIDNSVDSFPSWIVNNNKIDGDITSSKLVEVSGCSI